MAVQVNGSVSGGTVIQSDHYNVSARGTLITLSGTGSTSYTDDFIDYNVTASGGTQ